MCISNNRYSEPRVDFKDTILYGARVQNPNGSVEHVLAYYNKVAAIQGTASHGDFGWDVQPATGDDFGWDIAPRTAPKGNAMLFAVPIKPGSDFGPENLIAVREFPRFMEDYKKAVAPKPRFQSRGAFSFSLGGAAVAKGPIVVKGFDGGVYDVVMSPNASSIVTVLEQLDPDKRPEINQALYNELDIAYPGFAFVLFCFAERDAERAGCAAIRYTPLRDDLIFLPGLDGHNGFIERGQVELNHTLIVGSNRMKERVGERAEFRDLEPDDSPATVIRSRKEAPYWMLERVIGKIIKAGTRAPQGDFLFSVDDIERGVFRCRRQVPPGWSKLPGNPQPPSAQPFYITVTDEDRWSDEEQ